MPWTNFIDDDIARRKDCRMSSIVDHNHNDFACFLFNKKLNCAQWNTPKYWRRSRLSMINSQRLQKHNVNSLIKLFEAWVARQTETKHHGRGYNQTYLLCDTPLSHGLFILADCESFLMVYVKPNALQNRMALGYWARASCQARLSETSRENAKVACDCATHNQLEDSRNLHTSNDNIC